MIPPSPTSASGSLKLRRAGHPPSPTSASGSLKLRRAGRLYGILGSPLDHSLSPKMQNAAFAAEKISAVYMPLSIPPGRIRRALAGLKHAGFSGFNVTVPYKETVIPYLDRISPQVKSAGAVNTIVVDSSGKWVGHNTDLYGFQKLLERSRIPVRRARVLVIGAGGAAKAVCLAILNEVSSLDLANRTLARARRLRRSLPKKFQPKIRPIAYRSLASRPASPAARPYDLIINTTSVGLRPSDRLAVSDAILNSAAVAVDLIYNPPLSDFLRRARRLGCRAVGGLDMLLYQGARSFELWTGRPAPVAAMRRALREALR